jgi:hypothetical protein
VEDEFGNLKLKYDDGSEYIGAVRGQTREGYGCQFFKDDSFYSGEWVQDSQEGFGCFQSTQLSIKGFWKKGLFHGEGELKYKGTTTKGKWLMNQLMGPVLEIDSDNNTVFEGEVKNGVK